MKYSNDDTKRNMNKASFTVDETKHPTKNVAISLLHLMRGAKNGIMFHAETRFGEELGRGNRIRLFQYDLFPNRDVTINETDYGP